MYQPSFVSTLSSVPLPLLSLLRHTSVLTNRLKLLAPAVHMNILDQEWDIANAWEKQYLGINASIFRRNVIISSNNHACWYARTMIPEITYQQDPSFFARLQQEPLANLIYDEPRVLKYWMHSYGINAKNLEWSWSSILQAAQVQDAWMRVSAFQFEKNNFFYLAEIFLPDLLKILG